MNRNVKIAKQLVKLAKMMIADENISKIYQIVHGVDFALIIQYLGDEELSISEANQKFLPILNRG